MSVTRTWPLTLLSIVVLGGTWYSVINRTYFDTSDPLLAHLPHPHQHISIFARKSNIFNQLFVKKAWGWTSAAIAAVWITGPHPRLHFRPVLVQWLTGTIVWGAFAAWFFGPALFSRLIIASGGTCVVLLPGGTLAVPSEYCYTRTVLSPRTHPTLFKSSTTPTSENWTGTPRLAGGHDVSGHIFLLTLSFLSLYTQLVPAWRRVGEGRASLIHKVAVGAASALLALWLLMCLATAVYWHTPFEKMTGFALGMAGFTLTQIPFQSRSSVDMQEPLRQT